MGPILSKYFSINFHSISTFHEKKIEILSKLDLYKKWYQGPTHLRGPNHVPSPNPIWEYNRWYHCTYPTSHSHNLLGVSDYKAWMANAKRYYFYKSCQYRQFKSTWFIDALFLVGYEIQNMSPFMYKTYYLMCDPTNLIVSKYECKHYTYSNCKFVLNSIINIEKRKKIYSYY